MTDQTKGLIAVALVVVLIAVVAFFGAAPKPAPPIETRNCSDRLDRNDVEICEGDKITDSGDEAKINTVMYGTYKEQANQFYVMGQDGIPGPLNDLGDAPKEQRSLIVK